MDQISSIAKLITEDPDIFREAWGDSNRRDFLKRTGASTLLGGPGALLKSILGSGAAPYLKAIKTYESLDPGIRSEVYSFKLNLLGTNPDEIGDINNFESMPHQEYAHVGYSVVDGIVKWTDPFIWIRDNKKHTVDLFPVEAVLGSKFSESDPEDLNNWLSRWLSGRNPDIWNKFNPKLFSDIIDVAIEKHGIDSVFKTIRNIGLGRDTGDDPELAFGVWRAALSSKTLQKFLGLTPKDIKLAELNPRKLKELVDKDIVDQEFADDHGDWMREQDKNKRRKKEEEKKPEEFGTEPIEDFEPDPYDEYLQSVWSSEGGYTESKKRKSIINDYREKLNFI